MKKICLFALIQLLILGCSSDSNELDYENSTGRLPTIITTEVSEITEHSALSGGEITDAGGSTIIAKGVCWSKESSPTIADMNTVDGSGNAPFSSFISELDENTTYFLRSYATNKIGTAYGNQISFKSHQADPIIGVWTEVGGGTVYSDGTEVFTEFDDPCTKLGRYIFKGDGTFEIRTYDGPADACFITGEITGTWERNGDYYHLRIISDTSENSEAGREADLRIIFPSYNQMQLVFENESDLINYGYEQYELVE